MNTKERNELLELASRLERRARGKRVHARNLRNTADINRNYANEREYNDKVYPRADDGRFPILSSLTYTLSTLFNDYKRSDAERKRLIEEAYHKEKEADAADAKAAEMEAAAEQATMRAARGV